MITFPKPEKRVKVRKGLQRSTKPLRKIGPVSKHRLAIVAELKREAEQAGWLNVCEVGTVLRNRGITFVRCLGDLEFAHSVKCSPRGSDPVLDREVARSCELHHRTYLDTLKPALTAEIVREAIKRRSGINEDD